MNGAMADTVFDIRNYENDPPAKRQKTSRNKPDSKSALPNGKRKLPTNGQAGERPHKVPIKKAKKAAVSESKAAVEFTPRTKDDLCIDKRKLAAIDSWFQSIFVEKQTTDRVLVLYGQSGCAKTTTVRVLAQHYDVTLYEFEELQQTFYADAEEKHQNLLYERTVGNQIEQIESFVGSVNSITSKKDRDRRKAIVLKELPSTFYSNVERLHEFLERYLRMFRRRAPIIFIVTMNENMSNTDFKKLFPPNLHQSLSMHLIELNGVVKRQIKTVLDRINASGAVSKSDIDMLVEASNGDLRSAINALEFIVQSDRQVDRSFEIHENDRSGEPTLMAIKDTSPAFFHMLGKIMYCKRDGDERKKRNSKNWHPVKSVGGRRPLKESPEALADRVDSKGDTLVAFIHDCYPDFVSDDLNSATEIVSNLCFTDSHYSDGWQFEELDDFMKLTAIRGTMFNLNTKDEPSKAKKQFKAFSRPKGYAVREQEQAFRGLIAERGQRRGYRFRSKDELFDLLSFHDRDLFNSLGN